MKKVITILSLISFSLSAQESRLMRFPAVHGDQVVFVYAGDLYSVSKSGGVANRLTSDVGTELFPRISPDGKIIAFTGQYDGNSEVYTMPSTGGQPTRLTYTATLGRDDVSDRMGPNNIVMTWQDGSHIVYRSRKESFNDFQGKLYVASTNGGLSSELPFPRGGFCSFSPDGKQIAYNRIFREFRTWKYYKGGMADDISIYDFASHVTTAITSSESQDIEPMWAGNKIYFLSDRDRTMNLFCYDLTTKQTRKVTDYKDYDIKFASIGDKDIVWERGGYLYSMDLATEVITQVHVQITEDFPLSRNELLDASKFVEGWDIAPDGNRLVLTARGDVFTVPAENGMTKDLTPSCTSHERNAHWSPDGKWIAYISDATGEDEIYIRPGSGEGNATQLTSNSSNYKFELQWSPDSKMIMWADRLMRLNFIDVNSKQITMVDQDSIFEFNDYNFSPDSKWICYTRNEINSKVKVHLYNIETKSNSSVTNGWYSSYNPVFSDDGKFLLLVSDRDFSPTFSNTDFEISYTDQSKIYLVPLSNETASPFAPQNDTVAVKKPAAPTPPADPKAKKDDKPADAKPESKDSKVDLGNFEMRLIAVPVDPSNYFGLRMIGENIYYGKRANADHETSLAVFNVKEKKETVLGVADGFIISADGKKMAVKKGDNYAIMDLPHSKLDMEKKVDLSNMKIWVNHHEEWHQIFVESWRQMRDFFYAPNMHGLDWKAMRDKYEVLVPFVNHRIDLTYVIGEMIGELSIGHSYVGGGDYPKKTKIKLGLLGARLSRTDGGFYRINEILPGANWSEELRSPLLDPGVNVKAGDYIIAVNGKTTSDMADIYASLENTAGKQVELTVNSKASADGARKVIVIPIADEKPLYYYRWVEHNIHYVDSVTNGKVGYLHIPNMGTDGLNEFMKHFYPQITRKALIIDDRGNGGGFVSPLVTERLAKQLVYFEMTRNSGGHPDPDMILGPKVLLFNEYSASDGDIFPWRFKTYHLGTTIGKRSWGGVVGIRGTLPFVDGGFLDRPEFAPYAQDGSGWVIEGHGVDPDIVQDNDPWLEYTGTDQQLDKGIAVILEQLKTQQKNVPAVPPFKDKSK